MSSEGTGERERLLRQIRRAEQRRLRARARKGSGVWFGLGMLGLVGWSVALPTVAALALGVWLDARYQGGISWTLTLLTIGVGIGAFNAWYWVSRESAGDDAGGDEC